MVCFESYLIFGSGENALRFSSHFIFEINISNIVMF